MAEKICGIYKITNNINGKIYIGQSIDIYERWRRHKLLGKSKNISTPERKYPLYIAMHKYGIDNFSFEILLQCSPSELNDQEECYIQKYSSDSAKYGYNCRKQFHTTQKLANKDIQAAYFMLENTSCSMSEIAEEVKVAATLISQINQGKLHHDPSREYPIRNKEQTAKLHSILSYIARSSDTILSMEDRLNYSIDELYDVLYPNFSCRRTKKNQVCQYEELSQEHVQEIMNLLVSSAMTFSEIANQFDVSSVSVCQINNGQAYAQDDVEYPIRKEKEVRFVDYIKKHYPQETLANRVSCSITDMAYKYPKAYNRPISINVKCSNCGNKVSPTSTTGLCRKCYNEKIKSAQGLPESEINLNLIERILDSSLEAVAYEYGYTSGNAVKKLLRQRHFPYTRSAMFKYYEEQTGHPHSKMQEKENREQAARERNRQFAPHRVGQYDKNGALIAIYSSTREATRKTGVSNGSVSQCCNGTQNYAGGFTWRFLDENDDPISPADLATHKWNLTCGVCGDDTGSTTENICPRCQEHRRNFDRNNVDLDQLLSLLEQYPLGQLAKLCQCDPKTLFSWFERLGMPPDQVRRLNKEYRG